MSLQALVALWRRVRVEATSEVRRGRPTRSEILATVAMLLVMLTVASLRQGVYATPGAVLWTVTLLAWLPLLWRTRRPLEVLAAVVVAESLHLAVVPLVAPDLDHPVAVASYQPVPLATMVATWTVVTRAPRLLGWVTATAASAVLLAVALVSRPLSLLGTDIVMIVNLVLITAGIATVVANQRDRVVRRDQDRTRQVERAVTEERIRIARELHDVLAHHLTLVNAQAGVAEYLLVSDPDRAATALRGITDHTGRAIDELRVTVGLLRHHDAADGDDPPAGGRDGLDLSPVPGLGRLEELFDSFRGTGVDVEATELGVPLALDEHGDLAAYRIIQEAVTNATKHAPGHPVTVALTWEQHDLRLVVTNRLLSSSRPSGSVGTGHGLIGMRERALATGGTFEAREENRVFHVEATVPATREASA